MRLNDGTADAKSHARPLGLGRKEGVENLMRLLRREPDAGIADRYHELAVFGSRGDDELACAIQIFHRVDAVGHEVHQHLLQLDAISHYLGQIFGQFRLN
jgi:hypothetical protein